MKAINITGDGIIEYYGNRAGFIRDNKATVDDMFRKADLESFLKEQPDMRVDWKEGVYDMIVNGKIEDSVTLKMCRIHQLKPDVDMRMKFVGIEELERRGFGKPDMKNYKVVYDGNVGTNDLETIYTIFNMDERSEGFTGHSLSVSDVIELYDEDGTEFQYVDKFGFAKLDADQAPAPVPILEAKEQKEENKPFLEAETDIGESTPKSDENAFETEITTENKPKLQEPDTDDDFHVETFKITM